MVFLKYRSIRVDAPYFHIRVLLLQIFPNARNGPSGTNSDDKVGHLAFGLFPNFRSRAFVMGLAVAEVVVLVGVKGVWNLLIQSRGNAVVAVRMFGRDVCRTYVYFRTHGAQDVHFLFTLLITQGTNEFVSFDNGGQCKPHSRIS